MYATFLLLNKFKSSKNFAGTYSMFESWCERISDRNKIMQQLQRQRKLSDIIVDCNQCSDTILPYILNDDDYRLNALVNLNNITNLCRFHYEKKNIDKIN